MKIHIERFTSNNPDLTFDDVIQNIRAGVTEKGTVNVHFETRDKYIDVDANGTVYGPDVKGQMIRLHPHLWIMGDDGAIQYLDGGDDELYDHPDYWSASLVVDTEDNGYYNSTVIALKHEYFVSYVPDDEVMNRDCLGDVEIIEWVDDEVISYSTNWMGPINQKWIEEHGDCWSSGRIDIYGVPGEDYPLEYGLPAMHVEDWYDFCGWLDDFETHELWEFDDIIAQYEQERDTKIRWWKDES